ncbi:MAG: hypothetical protein HY703_09165, partial [Gemmatimonadetes bacterium]|nr:hypothetical protein [Gemmatimonadota bacterium]
MAPETEISRVDGTELRIEGAGVRAWDSGKAGIFFGLVAGVVSLDLVTKMIVQRAFHLYQQV